MAGQTLQDAAELLPLGPGERSEEILFGSLDRPLRLSEAALPAWSQLHQVPPAIGRIAWADDQPVGLESVEHPDQVAGVDAKLEAQPLLRERPRLVEVMKHGELVSSHLERREGLAKAEARHPSEAKDQDRGPGAPRLLGDRRVSR
jgi:hypothetical protein